MIVNRGESVAALNRCRVHDEPMLRSRNSRRPCCLRVDLAVPCFAVPECAVSSRSVVQAGAEQLMCTL